MKKIFKHLKLVNTHRFKVFKLCFKAGIPFRGMIHDLSKYRIAELNESVKYFNGYRSPFVISKKEKGYSKAWLHHKGRNKHHFEYWIDIAATDKTPIMPYKYAVELICDTLAAGMTYLKTDWTPKKQIEYFDARKDKDYMNVKIQNFVYKVYEEINLYGIDNVINKKKLKDLYSQCVFKNFKYTLYLEKEFFKTTWFEEFIPLLNKEITYYKPLNTKDSDLNEGKRNSKYIVYVITSEEINYLNIIKAINLSNKTPNRQLFCFIKKGFSANELKNQEEIKEILKNNFVLSFDNLKDMATFINENK